MLENSKIAPTIPVTNLDRAKDFYGKKLGLESAGKDPVGGMYFKSEQGDMLYVYERPGTPSEHTLASFQVPDVEKMVDDLRKEGVKPEEYDLPEQNIKTENGIAEVGGMKAAWIKDPDGNILAINTERR